MKVEIDLPNFDSDRARLAGSHPQLSDLQVYQLALANGLIKAGYVGEIGRVRLTLLNGRGTTVDMDWGANALPHA
jgi:hypothetical protein